MFCVRFAGIPRLVFVALSALGVGACSDDKPGHSRPPAASHSDDPIPTAEPPVWPNAGCELSDGSSSPDCANPECAGVGECPSAAALDRHLPSTVWQAAQFLFDEEAPRQVNADLTALDPRRVTLIHGVVSGADGQPLAGVRVHCPEQRTLGFTTTDGLGRYDLAVNGGGQVILDFQSAGWLRAQRNLATHTESYATAPNVQLIQPSVRKSRLTSGTSYHVDGEKLRAPLGDQRAFLVVEPGTEAHLIKPNGDRKRLSRYHLRITLYPTTGVLSSAREPGQTGATDPATPITENQLSYSFALSVDEARQEAAKDSEAGAAQELPVEFSQPIKFYLNNALGLGSGGRPVVYSYDFEDATWHYADASQLLRIVGNHNGYAALDVDNDGEAETPAEVKAFNYSEAEALELAARTQLGDSLFRTQVSHSGTFQASFATLAEPPLVPNELPSELRPNIEAPSAYGDVRVENLSVRRAFDVTGAPFRLVYESSRTPEYRANFRVHVPLLRDRRPAGLVRIYPILEVAGQRLQPAELLASGTEDYTFEWNGKDVQGRVLQGQISATLWLGYGFYGSLSRRQFDGFFLQPDNAGVEIESVVWRKHAVWVGGFDNGAEELGRLDVDLHHRYDSEKHVLYRGDGNFRNFNAGPAWVSPVPTWNVDEQIGGIPTAVASAADGSLFLAVQLVNAAGSSAADPGTRIVRHTPDGATEVVVGLGAPNASLQAPLGAVKSLALSPRDGTLFILDTTHRVVLALGPNGQLKRWIGEGEDVHIEHALTSPKALAVGNNGQLFIADRDVVLVAQDERVDLFAGGGPDVHSQNTTQLGLSAVGGLAVEPTTGELYVASTGSHRVYAISMSGSVRLIAGNGGDDFYGDDAGAEAAALNSPNAVVTGRDGSVWIADTANQRVRRVFPDGKIATLVGGGEKATGSNQLASSVALGDPVNLALGNDDTLYVLTQATAGASAPNQLLAVSQRFPTPGASGELLIPSDDGSEVYQFDAQGRHLATLDGLTSQELFSFDYDDDNRLTDVVQNEQSTHLEYASNQEGDVIVVAPTGEETQLVVDDRRILRLIDPDDRSTRTDFRGDPKQLYRVTEVDGDATTYEYDGDGRVSNLREPSGHETAFTLSSAPNEHVVDVLTGNDASLRYEVETSLHHATASLTLKDKAGAIHSSRALRDGTFSRTFPSGASIEGVSSPLFAWASQARYPASLVLTTASRTRQLSLAVGLRSAAQVSAQEQRVQLSAASLDASEAGYSLAGASFSRTGRSLIVTEPGGLSAAVALSDSWQPASVAPGGGASTQYGYSAEDRLESVTLTSAEEGEQSRSVAFAFDKQLIRTKTTAGTTQLSFEYDVNRRLTSIAFPDADKLTWTWRNDRELSTLALPGQPDRVLPYFHGQLLSEPTSEAEASALVDAIEVGLELAVDASVESYAYDAGRLSRIKQPGGRELSISYTREGRIQTIETPTTTRSFTYGGSGLLFSADTPEVKTAFVYDSPLLLSTFLNGQVQGTLNLDYDTAFRVSKMSFAGAEAIDYGYDADSNLIQAGPVTLTRDNATKSVSGWSLGEFTTELVRNGFGEIQDLRVEFEGKPLLLQHAERDALGRITRLLETTPNEAEREYTFAYDSLGHLTQATEGGSSTLYRQDALGNRLLSIGPGETPNIETAYAEGVITQAGDVTYVHSATVDMTGRSTADGNTLYDSDAFGDLLSVSLENGTRVTHTYDAFGHRMTRSVDGALKQTWIYHQHINPVFEVTPQGEWTSFIYASYQSIPSAFQRGEATYSVVTDLLGNVRQIVNTDSGRLVQELDYDAFGRVTRDTNPGFQPFGFGGGLYDPVTQLVRFGARDYDAEIGRFLMRSGTGDHPSTQRYVYANGDPINLSMPDGRSLVPHTQLIAERSSGTATLDALTAGLREEWGAPSIYNDVASAAQGSFTEVFRAIELTAGRRLYSSVPISRGDTGSRRVGDSLAGVQIARFALGPYLLREQETHHGTVGVQTALGRWFARCPMRAPNDLFLHATSLPARDSIATAPWIALDRDCP